MAERLARLLLLLAVLMMPFGMSTAASAAQSTSRHDMAGMAMGHCPDQGSQPQSKPGIAACTMVCAAALPAMEPARPQCVEIAGLPAAPAETRPLADVPPDAATPPPRTA